MQLELTNFYKYTKKLFTFPDVGMVLLKGISGEGKTTAMKAIDWAVNGGLIKKSWHGGAAAVTLDWSHIGLKIHRTASPYTLTVWTAAGETRDDVAQTEIYKALCGAKERFAVACYIKQRMKGALIHLGPAEQLRLIQSLAFGDEDPETTKAKIATTLTGLLKTLAREDAQLVEARERVNALAMRGAQHEAGIKEPEAPCDPVQIAFAAGKLKRAREESEKLYAELHAIAAVAAHPLYAKLAGLEEAERQLKAQGAVAAARDAEIQTQLDQLREPAPGKPSWTAAELAAKEKYLNIFERARELVAKAKVKFPEFTSGPLGIFLNAAMPAVEADLATLDTTIQALLTEQKSLVQTEDGQPCPECKTALTVRAGKIHKHTGHENKAGRLAELQEMLDDCRTTRRPMELRRQGLYSFFEESVNLKSSMGADPILAIGTRAQLEEARDALSSWTANEAVRASHYQSLCNERLRLTKAGDDHLRKLKQVYDDKHEAEKLQPLEQVRAKWAELTKQAEEKRTEVAALTALNEQIAKYSTEMQRVNAARAVLVEIQAQLMEAHAIVIAREKACADRRDEVGSWTRMRELSDMAAVQAVEDTITDINQNAQVWLGKLFPDDGTIVRILNTSKTQKGDEKAKLSMEITHKGFDAGKSDDELSGGEQDRVALSFQLAMGDMYSSPLLMVDEGFAGADFEKTLSLGLSALKEYSTDKLVVVIQHGAPEEFFDEVIELS